jgi:hypothetical protein
MLSCDHFLGIPAPSIFDVFTRGVARNIALPFWASALAGIDALKQLDDPATLRLATRTLRHNTYGSKLTGTNPS